MSSSSLHPEGPHAPALNDRAASPSGLWPEGLGSRLVARLQHRLAMHVPVTRAKLTNGAPIVSFTFDDVPRSAATLGAGLIEEYRAHATFYVSGRLAGLNESHWSHATADELLALHGAGHELACHTYAHVRMYELGEPDLAAEIERNEAFFHRLDPRIDLQNFAYPWGLGDFGRKRDLARHFRTCRSVLPGVNYGTIDPHFLRSVPLEDAHIDFAGVDRALDQAVAVNGWLVFYSHEVSDTGQYACSPALLRYALEGARRRGMQIASVAEAADLAGI